MLDVHVPHATHTWKDFFIHIATICVGLLIAIGLEQAVEAIHHHAEAQELRDSLQHESEEIQRDATLVETAFSTQIAWLKQQDEILALAATDRHTLGKLSQAPPLNFDLPDDPVYKAAKAANKFGLLTQQETEAYGEMDSLVDETQRAYEAWRSARNEVLIAQSELGFSHMGHHSLQGISVSMLGWAPFTGLTLPLADLEHIHSSSERVEVTSEELRYWSRQARGASVVMQQGERDLHQIEAAERQFNHLP